MDKDNDDQFIAVFCKECSKKVGFVVQSGHRDWICPKCSAEKKWKAVNMHAEEPISK